MFYYKVKVKPRHQFVTNLVVNQISPAAFWCTYQLLRVVNLVVDHIYPYQCIPGCQYVSIR